MNDNIIYEEIFEKTISKDELESIIKDLDDVYRAKDGWTIGKMSITPINDNHINITIPITKKELNLNDNTKRETFIRTVKKDLIDYTLNSLHETYEELGWNIFDTEIIPLNEKEVIIRALLTFKEKSLSH